MLRFLERGLWLSVLILAALGLMVAATALNLGGGIPSLVRLPGGESPRWDWVRIERLAAWFSVSNVTGLESLTNRVNPFFTAYFKPPPPPQTKKVRVVYMGSLTSSQGDRHAFVQIEQRTLVLTNGAPVAAGFHVCEIEPSVLILTNTAGQTNRVEFRGQTMIETPAR